MRSGDVVLKVENLDFFIGDEKILKDISFSVKKGDFTGLIGPNGSGKTTLLKCINKINKGDGNITIDDVSVEKLSGKKIARKIALMNQNTQAGFPFPALDVVLTGRYPYIGFARGESVKDYEIARDSMKFTNTLQFEKRAITNISGGERQRVYFAKILAQDTDIVLLDEPTSNLDIANEEQIFNYCCKLSKKGTTIVAAVHDLKIAAKYCDRLILLSEGSIMASGKASDVITRENLRDAYGVNAMVYRNRISGLLDFYMLGDSREGKILRIHIVGGGGSASGVIRELAERGHKITVGVLSKGDSDYACAEVFGIPVVTDNPFSGIGETAYKKNTAYIEEADITILCNMPFGANNLLNLKACYHAEKLVIIEDDEPEKRDYTNGVALEIYEKLKEDAIITDFARLHEVL